MDNEPVRESQVFDTINRIDKKLDTLSKVLSPILSPRPTNVGSDKLASGTKLIGDLDRIENKLINILDSVSL